MVSFSECKAFWRCCVSSESERFSMVRSAERVFGGLKLCWTHFLSRKCEFRLQFWQEKYYLDIYSLFGCIMFQKVGRNQTVNSCQYNSRYSVSYPVSIFKSFSKKLQLPVLIHSQKNWMNMTIKINTIPNLRANFQSGMFFKFLFCILKI
jgi:hypothetical protein